MIGIKSSRRRDLQLILSAIKSSELHADPGVPFGWAVICTADHASGQVRLPGDDIALVGEVGAAHGQIPLAVGCLVGRTGVDDLGRLAVHQICAQRIVPHLRRVGPVGQQYELAL